MYWCICQFSFTVVKCLYRIAVASCVMWKALLGNGVQCWSDGRITNDAQSTTLSSALNCSEAAIILVDLLEF